MKGSKQRRSSFNRFGIIRTLPTGVPQWVDTKENLAEAKAYLVQLAAEEPGEFYIYAEENGVIIERLVCVGIDDNSQLGASENAVALGETERNVFNADENLFSGCGV